MSEEDSELTRSQTAIRKLTKKFTRVAKTAVLVKRQTEPYLDPSVPRPPPAFLPAEQFVSTTHPDVNAIAAASGGGICSDEVTLSIPFNDTNLNSYASMLDFLLACYGIDMAS